MVGRVGAELCGAPAAQAGWLVCVEMTVSVSVFKMALACLLLWSDGGGFPGFEWPEETTAVLGHLTPS